MVTSMRNCRVSSSNAYKLLREGFISCVLSQDWMVNRIVPEFVNKKQFEIILDRNKKVLHLGIGNGECYRYFDKKICCIQSSISDKLYIDPYDIILLYLRRCYNIKDDIFVLAEIMRNEYLIAISYKELYDINKESFSEKDKYIFELLTKRFCKQNHYSYSFNVLRLLIYLLNTKPDILLPCTDVKRFVTPLGKHIENEKINKSYLKCVNYFNASISINDVVKIAIECFENINNIYISDFENVLLPNDLQYDYILATRSDAFLMKRYAKFVLNISKNINKKGFYISDGIVSSHSYELFYNEFDEIISELGDERVFLVKSENTRNVLPLQDISGIIIAGSEANIEDIYKLIQKNRLIYGNKISEDISFLRQCIWSDLFTWSKKQNIDLENFEFIKINSIINNYIDKKISNKHFVPIFDNEELFLNCNKN